MSGHVSHSRKPIGGIMKCTVVCNTIYLFLQLSAFCADLYLAIVTKYVVSLSTTRVTDIVYGSYFLLSIHIENYRYELGGNVSYQDSQSTNARVTLYTAGHLHTAVPRCSHSRAPGEQWARLCVFTLQDCLQAAWLCRGSPVKRLKDKNLFLEYVIDNKCFKRYTELLYLRCYIILQCKYNDCTWNVLDVLFFYIDRGSTVRRTIFFFFAKTKKKTEKGM